MLHLNDIINRLSCLFIALSNTINNNNDDDDDDDDNQFEMMMMMMIRLG